MCIVDRHAATPDARTTGEGERTGDVQVDVATRGIGAGSADRSSTDDVAPEAGKTQVRAVRDVPEPIHGASLYSGSVLSLPPTVASSNSTRRARSYSCIACAGVSPTAVIPTRPCSVMQLIMWK